MQFWFDRISFAISTSPPIFFTARAGSALTVSATLVVLAALARIRNTLPSLKSVPPSVTVSAMLSPDPVAIPNGSDED